MEEVESKRGLPVLPQPARILAGLLLVELLAVSLIYHHAFTFECRAAAPVALCAFLGFGVIRAIAVAGVLMVLLMRRGAALLALGSAFRETLHGGWLALHLGGFALVMAPLGFVSDGAGGAWIALGMACWLGGLLAAGIGAVLAAIPGEALARTLRAIGPATLAAAVGLAALAPEIADLFQRIWQWDAIQAVTFSAVEALLRVFEDEVVSEPEIVRIGANGFNVLVGRQCSGVEGFALITGFLGFYIWLFRDRLAFPRVWLLIPLGILLSWIFNVVRIVALIEIGAHVSPNLAINGFHSHAGWMMFTILAVSIAWGVHHAQWFRADGVAVAARRAPPPPFFEDPMAARILPFIVFMATALLASTFSQTPGITYPFRAVAMAGALWLFRAQIAAMDWRLDPVALGAGLAVGLLWIVTAPEPGEADLALAAALAGLPAAGFALWALSRVLGTVLLVPLIEELFFRGYVLARLDGPGWRRGIALAVSAGLFALLHGRWLEAGLAGVVFGLVMLRRGRLADAVIAHAAANGAIALWALARGDWSVI